MAIKEDSKRITITLNKEELQILNKINHATGKKTYSKAIKWLIKYFNTML